MYWQNYFFLIFIIFMSVQRWMETFSKREKVEGIIYYPWTFRALQVTHMFLVAGCVLEFFVIKRKVDLVFSLLGLVLYLAGIAGRNFSIASLGKYHSVHIELRDNQPLIKKGFYRFMRHPYYFSVIFEIIGFPLVGNTYFTLIAAVTIYIPMMVMRIALEEKKMKEKFGVDYLVW